MIGVQGAVLVWSPLVSAALGATLAFVAARQAERRRLDYRAEWARFTDTLGLSGADADPLDARVVQAMAHLARVESGLLLLADETGGLAAAARFNWPDVACGAPSDSIALARHLEERGETIALDGKALFLAPIPVWMEAVPHGFAIVPLVHIDRLIGAVLLAASSAGPPLGAEMARLLRIAGRQAASYLAEARGQEALSDARRFAEFNRRFAFIIHDIKNLVSQLNLVSRNAERHADNPAFRADMIATLNNSTTKMTELLARLSQHQAGRAEPPRPTPLRALVDGVVAAKRAQHAIRVDGRADLFAAADATRLEQAIAHLLQNAIDASPGDEPVWLRLERRGIEAVIEIIDQGSGMSPEFIRTRLFKPFSSTKAGGFGIGAFEARALVIGMGGRMEVESREGEGSRFTLFLPIAEATRLPLPMAVGQ